MYSTSPIEGETRDALEKIPKLLLRSSVLREHRCRLGIAFRLLVNDADEQTDVYSQITRIRFGKSTPSNSLRIPFPFRPSSYFVHYAYVQR